ncbi:MAG TPA: LPS assembly lipoprotein LptE [Oligoflexia bacterium]|nr:LPS assembly lipoprotein LptE [Oligoflexia bacterium]HMP26470.1 LPS assembly lipoprotein LptE [Oligoflexia bacterium]
MYYKLTLIVILSALCLTACGYSLQGAGTSLPPDVKNIYIERVENNTIESQLTRFLEDSLRDRFERFGTVVVVDNLDQADAVLYTRILKLERQIDTVRSVNTAADNEQISVTVSGELKRPNGSLLWREPAFPMRARFGTQAVSVVGSSASFASSNLDLAALGALNQREVARSQEQEALRGITDSVAQYIYDQAIAKDF